MEDNRGVARSCRLQPAKVGNGESKTAGTAVPTVGTAEVAWADSPANAGVKPLRRGAQRHF